MKFHIIASGSKGNSTLIENDGRFLLVDMGICLKRLKEELEQQNINLYNLEALLLTHNHSDHTKGVCYLNPIPIFCTKGTYDCPEVNEIKPFKPFNLIGLKIIPIEASHDAPNPVGYVFKNKDEKFVYLTDTGYIPEKSLKYMSNADFYVIESNHDIKMQRLSHRPAVLIQRILSDQGHLCNEASAIEMAKLVGDKTKQIFLAHISEDCNTPELAIKAYNKIFRKNHIDLSKIEIVCAKQYETVHGGKRL